MSNRIPTIQVKLPLNGNLLVATHRCSERGLQGSVCLILHHSAEGSMGLVLNRAIDVGGDGLWKFLSAPQGREGRVIRFGGPVSGPILALHNQIQWAEAAAGVGVYIAARLDKLQQLVGSRDGEVRLVVGQVVWQRGQLEREIIDGQWLPVPATPELVFAPEEEMWHRGLLEAGNRFVSGLVNSLAPAQLSSN